MKNFVEVKTQVYVRKYPVEITELQYILRQAKKQAGISNKSISDCLNVPITQVEHWFRTDKCFSIPPPQLWFELKELLKINNDTFDTAITTYEIKENVFDMSNRIYLPNNYSPTITCECSNINVLIKDITV